MTNTGKTMKEKFVEFVRENPGYTAKEIDEAMELPEKTMSAYAKALVDDRLLRREKKDSIYIYFEGRKKLLSKKADPLAGKTVPVPKKNDDPVSSYDKMMLCVQLCPGLTSGEVAKLSGVLVNNVSSCFTKKRRNGLLTRTYNSRAQSIWFPVPYTGRRIPADASQVVKMLADGIDFAKEKSGGSPVVEKKAPEKKVLEKKEEKVVKEAAKVETVKAATPPSSGMQALMDENDRMGEELDNLGGEVSAARDTLADLNKQIELLAQVAERRKKLEKLKGEKTSLSTAIEDVSTRLLTLKNDILQ